VSGHRELADRTGAEIVFGEKANATFPHRAVKDGDELRVGRVCLSIMETPGHTPEGISVLVFDSVEMDAPAKLLTGDTLFIGDVGRPDLAGSKGHTAEEMAGMLYDSLRNKIMSLADSVDVYPAHGAGSMCGRNISSETSSTIGAQKQFNYALQPMERSEFIAMMTHDLPEAPSYFAKDAEINRSGAAPLQRSGRPPAFNAAHVHELIQKGHAVLDVRPSAAFGNAHIPGAVNLGLSGQFASWAGSLLDMDTPLIIVAEDFEGVDEAVLRLARVGIESVKGYLEGGMYSWDAAGFPVNRISQLPAEELMHMLQSGETLQVIDVRRPPEFTGGHIEQAVNIPLSHLQDEVTNLDRTRSVAVLCQSGYRSSAASSILAKGGFPEVYNVIGGMNAYKKLAVQTVSA
jgi:rhodanese-related sulfurtransferase/glyoxylase-like metal-dependent hydrolase (beta-lactamase superfamily II)